MPRETAGSDIAFDVIIDWILLPSKMPRHLISEAKSFAAEVARPATSIFPTRELASSTVVTFAIAIASEKLLARRNRDSYRCLPQGFLCRPAEHNQRSQIQN
jgi:hypothetical protein